MRRQYGNKNAMKGIRSIELGWIHKAHLRTKQVRSQTGGGTRKVNMKKDATKQDMLQEAIKLFFPNGESPKGRIEEFTFDLWDFSEREVNESLNLQEMYEETKMPILMFYLASSLKNEEISSTHDKNSTQDVVAEAMELAGIVHDYKHAENDDNFNSDVVEENLQKVVPISESSRVDDHDFLDSLYTAPDLPDLGDIAEKDFNEEIVLKEMKIRVHRGQVLKDLITAFGPIDLKDVILSFEVVMPNGDTEVAEDGGGVTRDTLAEFWSTFFDQCTLGTEVKVPCLRHDFGELEWTAVGKVFLFGWQSQRYFPVNLARPFIEQCFYGKVSSPLLEAFYNYIPPSEAATLKVAMTNFEEVEFDELLDVMALHDCKKTPTRQNLPQIIEEMAHEELIQAPMFVCDCFYSTLKNLVNEAELAELYKKLTPTGKGVLRVLSFPENMSPGELISANHLKRFIKELNPDKLKRFLRFCTGSNLLTVEKISVSFVNVTGLARWPVAHTCSCMVELSKHFDSFPQFRSEFNSVLESNYWQMDFI